MAKYTVDYACGHGNRVMQLFGKTAERTRRIEWMQRNVSCPTCNKAERVERDTAAPREAVVHISGVPKLIAVELTGQVEANQEMLRDRGWAWSKDAVGALGMLATREEWRFVRTWDYKDETTLRAALADITLVLNEIGWVAQPFAPLDVAVAVEAIRREEKANANSAAAVAANPRPVRPTWYAPDLKTGESISCNRVIYGNRDKAIYVNGTKIAVTADQVTEIEAYWRQYDAWKKASTP